MLVFPTTRIVASTTAYLAAVATRLSVTIIRLAITGQTRRAAVIFRLPTTFPVSRGGRRLSAAILQPRNAARTARAIMDALHRGHRQCPVGRVVVRAVTLELANPARAIPPLEAMARTPT